MGFQSLERGRRVKKANLNLAPSMVFERFPQVDFESLCRGERIAKSLCPSAKLVDQNFWFTRNQSFKNPDLSAESESRIKSPLKSASNGLNQQNVLSFIIKNNCQKADIFPCATHDLADSDLAIDL